jgi:hypothetical protein
MSIFTIKHADDQQPSPELMGQLIIFKVKPVVRSEDGRELFEFETCQLYRNYEDEPKIPPDRLTHALMTWSGVLQLCAMKAAAVDLLGFFVAVDGRKGPVKIEHYPEGVTFYSAWRNEKDGIGQADAPVPEVPSTKDHRQIAIERALEAIHASPEAKTPLIEKITKILTASATIDDETANPAVRKFLRDRGGLAQPTDVDYPLGGTAISEKS